MKRRKFLTLLSGAAASPMLAPLAARAQQPMPVVGFLSSASVGSYADRLRAFRQGLGESGYVEGQNVAIEYRWSEGHNDRFPAMVADLTRLRVTVIAANGIPAALAARAATTTIPIVFQGGFDPVAVGLVGSLRRPGGNLTGVSTLGVQLGPKQLELLHELIPTAGTIALLVNPTNPTNADIQSRDVEAAARKLGLELRVLPVSSERDFGAVFATLKDQRVGGLVIGNDGLFIGKSEQLAALSVRHAVPTIFQYREFAAAGGLMSYAGSETDAYHLSGGYVGRILKGEKAAELPVQQATKVELFINLKTAKALGIMVPLPLLGLAEEVIE